MYVVIFVFDIFSRRGPVKYKFQTLYELDSLAVVNARDVGPCKNAFKILMFPDTRMFQADNPKTKVCAILLNTWKQQLICFLLASRSILRNVLVI